MTTDTTPAAVPSGFRKDAKGRLIPEAQIKPIDLLRDQLVLDLVASAKRLEAQVAAWKTSAFSDIGAFLAASAEQYGVKPRGDKGNVTLYSFDGRFKIVRAMADNIRFGEQLQTAKQLIDECITEWSADARSELRALIGSAFEVDGKGQVSTDRVLGLLRLEITDAKWKTAMQAITDSIQVVGSSAYVRVYERIGDSEQYRMLQLSMSGVSQ
jgi:Protein of unknown function (DUF3164)